MPCAKDISSYPVVFHEMADAGPHIKNPVSFVLADKKEAEAWRFSWYNFIRAMEKEIKVSDATDEFFLKVHNARRLSLSIHPLPKGYKVTITPRNLTREAQIGEIAMEAIREAMSDEDAEAMMDAPAQRLEAQRRQDVLDHAHEPVTMADHLGEMAAINRAASQRTPEQERAARIRALEEALENQQLPDDARTYMRQRIARLKAGEEA